MGFTRADLTDPRYTDADHRELQALYERYLECDLWAKKAQLPIGVLLTSHPSNRSYLKASVESHKKLGYWLTLAYDNYLNPKDPNITPNQVLPAKDVLDNLDCFVMPHHQTWGGVLYPYFWLLKFGMATMSHFEYVYCSNGDCILEKPENFSQIIDLLGDADIMDCGWERGEEDGLFNSTAFITKSSAFRELILHFEKYFIPFDNYEKYTQDFGNCERRMAIAVTQLGLKHVKVTPGFNTQFHVKGVGTWWDILGFRHIHAEHNYAYRNRLTPPEIEYFDERFVSGEYATLKKYWETKDESVLEDWWVKP
jgi:hypothetical protein